MADVDNDGRLDVFLQEGASLVMATKLVWYRIHLTDNDRDSNPDQADSMAIQGDGEKQHNASFIDSQKLEKRFRVIYGGSNKA